MWYKHKSTSKEEFLKSDSKTPKAKYGKTGGIRMQTINCLHVCQIQKLAIPQFDPKRIKALKAQRLSIPVFMTHSLTSQRILFFPNAILLLEQ